MIASKLFLAILFAAAMVSAQVSAQELGSTKNCWEEFDTAQAISNCTTLLAAPGKMSDEERAKAYAGRGSAFLSRNDSAQALKDFDEAIGLDQKLFYSFYGRGLAEFRMEKFDEAISDFSEVIRFGETRLLLLAVAGRGAAYRLQGDLERAIADFNEALRLDNAGAEIHARLGEAYLAKKEIERAIAEFSAAIRSSLNTADARQYYVWRGKAYLQANELEKSLADFGYAIAISPSADAYAGRAEAHQRMGNEQEATADFDRSRRVTQNPFKAIIP